MNSEAPNIALIVAALGAIPLFFVFLPILSPILGSAYDLTTSIMSTDSGNLTFNAFFPWFALAFALSTFVIMFFGFRRMGHRLGKGNR